uniref:Uncharacterized protein n=1 Tax=Micrurus lemniscatus lemniscatus TaxID=129467 RepID=A0A2D4I074_MICLE
MERCFAKGARNLRVISNSDLKVEHLLYLSQRRLVRVQSPAVLSKTATTKTKPHTWERNLILNERGLKPAYIPTMFGFQDNLEASTGKCCTSHSAKGSAQTNGQPSGLHQH